MWITVYYMLNVPAFKIPNNGFSFFFMYKGNAKKEQAKKNLLNINVDE